MGECERGTNDELGDLEGCEEALDGHGDGDVKGRESEVCVLHNNGVSMIVKSRVDFGGKAENLPLRRECQN